MDLCFKPLEASDVEALRPYFSLRSNLTCDSVILDSFLWKDYYGCEFALVEGEAVLLLSHIGFQAQADKLDRALDVGDADVGAHEVRQMPMIWSRKQWPAPSRSIVWSRSSCGPM